MLKPLSAMTMFRTISVFLGVAAATALTYLGISSGGDVKGTLVSGGAMSSSSSSIAPTCKCPYSPQPGGPDTCEGTYTFCNQLATSEEECYPKAFPSPCNDVASCGSEKIYEHTACEWVPPTTPQGSWHCAPIGQRFVSCHLVQHPTTEVRNDFCDEEEYPDCDLGTCDVKVGNGAWQTISCTTSETVPGNPATGN